MNNLTILNQNGQLVTDSREVAKMVGKGHKNLLRDIKGYMGILESSTLSPQNFFIPSNYKTKGNNKTYDCYLLTKNGCDMVANKMTGKKGVLFTATYVTKFDEMEKQIKTNFKLPTSFKEALLQLVQAEDEKEVLTLENKQKDQLIVEQKPKVIFADAVSVSHTSILVGDLAKILKQNGIDVGANRLFERLRTEGYLIRRKGTDYNMPTQKSMELKLFEVKETAITHSDGHITISKTTKVNGKGQIYFVNKFKESIAI